MNTNLRINQNCYIALPSCNYVFESAKMCFIACPSDEKYTLYQSMIKKILQENVYECHIAVRTSNPGKNVFCSKICSKIIQSQFCIVFLDPSFDSKNKPFPNPNVYFEYGMMLTQNKYIIPFQHTDHSLPFNVYNLDTIKYTDKDFEALAREEIAKAIEKFSLKETDQITVLNRTITQYYLINGYGLTNVDTNTDNRFVYEVGYSFGFSLFNTYSVKGLYKFVGYFANDDTKNILLNTKLLIQRFDKLKGLMELGATIQGKTDLLSKLGGYEQMLSIDVIIAEDADKGDFVLKLNGIVDSSKYDSINVLYYSEIEKKVEEELGFIGKVKLKPNK